MTKRNIIETIYEYDEKGTLVRKTVTETEENDDAPYLPYSPWTWMPPAPQWWENGPTCTCCSDAPTSSHEA